VRPPPEPNVSDVAREAALRGIGHLLKTQEKNGSWGRGETIRPVEILADIPGSHHAFRVGTTALCVMALARSSLRAEECREAHDRALAYLLDNFLVRRPNGMEMYNVWSYGYGLRAFAEELARNPEPALAERLRDASRKIIEKLEVYQTPDGGWGYYDFDAHTRNPSDSSMSFTTATILVSLHLLEKQGIEVPQPLLDRALKSLKRCRLESGAYVYGPYAQYRLQAGFNKVKGSLGRTQACNLALWSYGEGVSEDDLRAGMENFFRYHHFMDIGRKRPWPHEAWYYTSGYYFYYGHYYTGLVLDLLPEADRARWRPALEKLLLDRQEPDGSWWDFPFYGYHKPYGTAYALLVLLH
jgi:squalene cyclase